MDKEMTEIKCRFNKIMDREEENKIEKIIKAINEYFELNVKLSQKEIQNIKVMFKKYIYNLENNNITYNMLYYANGGVKLGVCKTEEQIKIVNEFEECVKNAEIEFFRIAFIIGYVIDIEEVETVGKGDDYFISLEIEEDDLYTEERPKEETLADLKKRNIQKLKNEEKLKKIYNLVIENIVDKYELKEALLYYRVKLIKVMTTVFTEKEFEIIYEMDNWKSIIFKKFLYESFKYGNIKNRSEKESEDEKKDYRSKRGNEV